MKESCGRICLEKRVIVKMIILYCKKNHKDKYKKREVCEDCKALTSYALKRLDHCGYGDSKTSCSHCPTQCYKKDMKESIRAVMRYSGPRILFHFPFLASRYLIVKKRAMKKNVGV